MQRRLTEYIRKPDTMDQQAIAQLRTAVQRYPYNHSARILLLQALHRQHDTTFDAELRRSAPLVPNRQAIFRLIEEKNYQNDPARLRYTIADEDKQTDDTAEQLIDTFLNTVPEEPQPSHRPIAVDATQDYISYLLQTAPEDEQQTAPSVDEHGIIDEYLEKGNTRILISDEKKEGQSEENSNHTAQSETPSENEILTESLAHIYIKQGKFEKAIEIIRRLSLKYPKKNRYFADQIRFLEKLVINNKNK